MLSVVTAMEIVWFLCFVTSSIEKGSVQGTVMIITPFPNLDFVTQGQT